MRAASMEVLAKIIFSTLGLALIVSRVPKRLPMTAAIARITDILMSKCPVLRCPKKPAVAVIRTKVVEVPTAICMGTPIASTISGTKNGPPEIPTIPDKKPVIITMGIKTNKLI